MARIIELDSEEEQKQFSGIPASSRVRIIELNDNLEKKTEQHKQRNFFEELSRQLGLTVRHGVEGGLALPSMLADVPATVAGAFGVNVPKSSEAISSLLTRAGVPKPETPMERVVGAGSRGLAGAATTMGAGSLLSGASGATGGVGQSLMTAPKLQAIGATAGPVSGQSTAEMGGGPLAQFMASIAGGTLAPMAGYKAGIDRQLPSARQAAEKMVGKAFERDILAEDAGKQLAALGQEARNIDIGGPNVRQLAQSATSYPGKAKKIAESMLVERSKTSTRRLINDAKKTLGTNKEVFQTTKQIITDRKKLSEPFYLESNKIEVDVDEGLKQLMQRPAMRKAYSTAINKAMNDVDWPTGIKVPKDIKDSISGDKVPLPLLDYVKRSLDDEIGSSIRKNKMDNARIFHGLKRELIQGLDDKYPQYKQAREIFSDKSSMLNAMETGKKILRSEPDEMMEFVADMTKSEKEMFVVGAMKSITDKLKGTRIGSNAANQIATDLVRDRIRPAFKSNDDYMNFLSGLERENVFMRSKNILGGSPTQQRQASAAQLGGEAAEIAMSPATGTFNTIKRFLSGERAIPERVRNEIAEILFVESMAKPGSFSNKTIARMQGYRIPRRKLNELAVSLTSSAAYQENQ